MFSINQSTLCHGFRFFTLSSPPTYAFSAENLMAAASKLSSSADGEWEKHFSEIFQQESAFFSSILIGRRSSIGPILMDGEG